MKIVVTGSAGQLGRAVRRRAVLRGHAIEGLDIDRLDIRERHAVARALDDARPDVVVNAAAYTHVDKAETERELAFAVNSDGAANLAAACQARNTKLLHVSTDYVFDGRASVPIKESAPLAPLGVYGESKAAGERAVHAAGGTVVRTSWLFEQKGPSFVHTMLRLARERPVLRVVADQFGCPTWADDLADALLTLGALAKPEPSYHFCNEGAVSWHGFAEAIFSEARKHVPLTSTIEAITTAEYPTPARRPAYSVLDTTLIRAAGVIPPHWSTGLAHVVAEVLQ